MSHSQPGRPHILLFNPDSWRGDVMGHLGDSGAVTPNLDRSVATDCVSFRHAYCQNPVCTPSRVSFMTGWYPHTAGHRTMTHSLQPHEPMLLRELKKAGYFIWWGGKNDTLAGQHGYEDACDIYYHPSEADFARWGMQPDYEINHHSMEWRGEPDADHYYSFLCGKLEGSGQEVFLDKDWQHVLGAIDMIENYEGDAPLCIVLNISFPHPPYAVEEPYFSMIDRSKLPPRRPTPQDWRRLPAMFKGLYDLNLMQDWDEERWKELKAVYYGMCARVDEQWRRVLEAFRRKGIYDDTAMFMFSDHGDFTGDYGLVEKSQNLFPDDLTRVPFVIKPPRDRAAQPRVSEALVELVDLSATVYDLAGIQPDYTYFGKSLMPLIVGETDTHRDAVFCEGGRMRGEVHCAGDTQFQGKMAARKSEDIPLRKQNNYYPKNYLQVVEEPLYHGKAAMCRTHTHKYVKRFYEMDELYDLAKDPDESHNAIDDPAYAKVLQELRGRLLDWYMETSDVVPHRQDYRNFQET